MATRFEAMLATAMALGDGDPAATAATWRQIVDILAQAGSALPDDVRVHAAARLDTLGPHVPPHERRLAAASLAGRTRDPVIARIFATDEPAIAAPFLARVALSDTDWSALVPAMPATSRNILRNRRDLPPVVVDLLRRFGPGDMALPGTTALGSAASGVTAIQELVDRIAAYRERVPQVGPDEMPSMANEVFAFETALDGTIDWVHGVAREAIVGLAISDAAPFGGPGVDGQAAGAWRRRAPFTDARLAVAGTGSAGGDWLISAAPLFNPRDGRFCGYRGEARRPQPGERASERANSAAVPADSLRQLVHELRTPLNAIHGFAEMIDLQLLGPVDAPYRERARAVIDDARRLTALVDDLDVAARLDSGVGWHAEAEQVDVAALVEKVIDRHRRALATRGITVKTASEPRDALGTASFAAAERMIARLFAATAAVAVAAETIDVDVAVRADTAVCSISRPAALIGRDERALLDPDYGTDGDWPDAPLLGLGFTLRLVARLAVQAGGKLVILPDRFDLVLPRAQAAADERIG